MNEERETVINFFECHGKLAEIDFLIDYLWTTVEENNDQASEVPIVIELVCDNEVDSFDGADLARDLLGLYLLINDVLPEWVLSEFPRHKDVIRVVEENRETLFRWASYTF